MKKKKQDNKSNVNEKYSSSDREEAFRTYFEI